jgi:hypothetical protein
MEKDMESKPAKLLYLMPTLVLAGILMATLHNVAMASPADHGWSTQTDPEQRQEFIKMRLHGMEDRLEIKSSQLAAWEDYAKAMEAMAERPAKMAESKDDAASIAHFHADRAAELAKKLTRVADATDKLQAVLNEDQRKLLDEMVQDVEHKLMRHKLEWRFDHDRDGGDEMHPGMRGDDRAEGMGRPGW